MLLASGHTVARMAAMPCRMQAWSGPYVSGLTLDWWHYPWQRHWHTGAGHRMSSCHVKCPVISRRIAADSIALIHARTLAHSHARARCSLLQPIRSSSSSQILARISAPSTSCLFTVGGEFSVPNLVPSVQRRSQEFVLEGVGGGTPFGGTPDRQRQGRLSPQRPGRRLQWRIQLWAVRAAAPPPLTKI